MQAALRRDQLTLAAFARDNGLSQQTLDYIVRGKTKRCRQSLIERLAGALAVSHEWLTGATHALDDSPGWKEIDDRYLAAFPLAWRALIDQLNDVAQRERIPHATRDRIENAVRWLTDPRMWRWALFGLDPRKNALEHGPLSQFVGRAGELRSGTSLGAELDDWLQATLADVLSVILLPWFRNEATLNVRALCAAAPRPQQGRRRA